MTSDLLTGDEISDTEISGLLQQYLTFRKARERFAKNEDRFKKVIMEALDAQGQPDDKGNRFYHLDTPLDGVAGVKRERRLSQILDEDAALEVIDRYKLHESCLETIQVINEEALLAANFSGVIPDKEMQDIYQQKETFAFVLVKDK